jgi:hypothetical protein
MGSDGVLITQPAGDDYFSWSYCGPTAVANSLWWLDSKFDPSSLVESYGAWDDHSTNNVQPLISDLAWVMDTDAQRTLGTRGWWVGTFLDDVGSAIDWWLNAKGLASSFSRKTIAQPTFQQVVQDVKGGAAVVLLVGFWGQVQGQWQRFGGHFVTVAGVDSESSLIALSNPIRDTAAPGAPSHNDAQYVSHDIYTAVLIPSLPWGTWGPQGYGTVADVRAFFGANPSPMIVTQPALQASLSSLRYVEQQQWWGVTVVEYATVVSPAGGTVEIGYDDGIFDEWRGWTGPGGMYAVRFSPAVSGLLETVRFYIYSSPATIRVHIMDQSRADIVPSFLQTPSATGWFDVDVLAKQVSVTSGVDFYVGAEWTVANAPTLGVDTSSPDGRSWKFNGASWSQLPTGDYMIRAIVQLTTVVLVPVSSVKVSVVEAAAGNVYLIYPDYDPNHSPKGNGARNAALSDFTAMGVVYGMAVNQQILSLDTSPTYVTQSTGKPLLAGKAIVLVGGQAVHASVKYYDDQRITPVYPSAEGTMYYWYTRAGVKLTSTAMDSTLFGNGISYHQDMFVVECFQDSDSNLVFIIYGYGWKGSFAGGNYFKSTIYPNIGTYTHAYYIYQWVDANNDGFPDLNEITPVTNGD